MKILYIIIGDLGKVESGSGLRPACMYHAFCERGHEVYVLSGYQGRNEGKLRAVEVKKAIAWTEKNKPDLCYIESSTYPMIHPCDYKMIRYLATKNIPTSYFYRDFYHKFPEQFPMRSGIARIKDLYLSLLRKKTDSILHKIDLIYFPSEESLKYFSYKNQKALPPAADKYVAHSNSNSKTSIYVGGISQRYGWDLLMNAFSLLNHGDEVYKLILVCRENEFKNKNISDIPSWLEIHHTSGDGLIPLYEKADIGLIALQPDPYNNVAICIKLFQYLNFGLPVISTDTTAMTKLIKENNFGEVADYDAKIFAKAIREILSDDNKLNEYRQAIKENITNNHLWVHRVDQIIEDLTK